MRTVERSRDRKDLVRAAGMPSLSFISILAGVFTAYGTVLLLLGIAAGVGNELGFETGGISDNEWRDIGIGAAVAVGVVLFISYFFGGYVAGRMGRRAGLVHGLFVFLLGLVVVAVAAGAASLGADGEAISDELANQGIPTEADDWSDIGLFGGLGVLAAMLLGALLGGIKGERWHGKLAARAFDPDVTPRGGEDDVDDGRTRRGDEGDDLDERPRRVEHTDLTPRQGGRDRTAAVPVVVDDDATRATPAHRDVGAATGDDASRAPRVTDPDLLPDGDDDATQAARPDDVDHDLDDDATGAARAPQRDVVPDRDADDLGATSDRRPVDPDDRDDPDEGETRVTRLR